MHRNLDWFSFYTRRPDARYRLFCIPYAGGGENIYQSWSVSAPKYLEVIGVRLPAHGSRISEPPVTDIEILTGHLTTALRVYNDKPIALFGHSVGALLAYLTCRELAKNISNIPKESLTDIPLALFVSGREAPSVKSVLPPLHNLPASQLVTELNNRYRGIPDDVMEDQKLLEKYIPALQADLKMNETYRHQQTSKLPCSICAFGGRTDPCVNDQALVQWQKETTGNFALQCFNGAHFFLNDARDTILQTIGVWLEHESILAQRYQ